MRKLELAVAFVALAGGCRKEAPAAAPAAAKSGAKTWSTVAKPVSVKPGESASATVEIATTSSEWHLNPEFPTTAVVTAGPGLSVAKDRYTAGSGGANEIDITKQRLRLDVPVKGDQAGARTMSARVRFGLCSPSTCVPHEEDVSWQVTVSE